MAKKNGQKLAADSSKMPFQSTPAPASKKTVKPSFRNEETISELPSPVLSDDNKKAPKSEAKIAKTPPMLDMICDAIKSLEGGKKGSSVPAIKKWIMGNYNGISESGFNLRLRKALVKGIEIGMLDRPTKSAEVTGAKGFFIVKLKQKKVLAKKKPEKAKPVKSKAKKAKKEDLGVTYVSDSEMTVAKPNHNKSKMHVSDSDLPPDATTVIKAKAKTLKKTKTDPKKIQKKADENKKEKKAVAEKKAEPKLAKQKAGKNKKAEDEEKLDSPPKEKPPVKKTNSKPKKATESDAKAETAATKKAVKKVNSAS